MTIFALTCDWFVDKLFYIIYIFYISNFISNIFFILFANLIKLFSFSKKYLRNGVDVAGITYLNLKMYGYNIMM